MPRRSRPRLRCAPAAALALILVIAGVGSPRPGTAQQAPTVVYLVRHAEKAERPSEDPPLTAAGQARARALAHVLRDAAVDRIHSTDTERTRATAGPTAAAQGLPVETYEGEDLEALAGAIRSSPGRHLVVGHSNTTPELVALLGGEPGAPVVEAWEYDRLYVLELRAGAPTTTILLRYGDPAGPGSGGARSSIEALSTAPSTPSR